MKKIYALMLCAILFSCSKENQLIDSKKEELFSPDSQKIDISTGSTSTWMTDENSETSFVDPEIVIEWENKSDNSEDVKDVTTTDVINSLKDET